LNNSCNTADYLQWNLSAQKEMVDSKNMIQRLLRRLLIQETVDHARPSRKADFTEAQAV
jgi:hypothetical protein